MNSFEKSAKYERAIWASKVLLVLVGMISTVILLKTTVIPYFQYVTFSILPQLWLSFRSWVSPLYIYLVLNLIIFAIAATSTFPTTSKQSSSGENKTANHNQNFIMDKNNPGHSHGIISLRSFHFLQEKKPIAVADDDPLPDTNSGEYPSDERITEDRDEKNDGFVGEEEVATETNLDEYSTLESTWKAIMERQGKGEEARLLTKSDTLPLRTTLARADHDHDHDDRVNMDGEDGWGREMGKWETLSEYRVSLTRDKSISPEELNKRAEAFINKVNNDMRLQRLESDQRFMDMVNRGL